MRPLDWVDWLAGVDTLEEHMPDGWLNTRLRPTGPWLAWPWWRRLLDLLRAWTIGRVLAIGAAARCAVICWGRWGQADDGSYWPTPGDAYQLIRSKYDIHYAYEWLSERD